MNKKASMTVEQIMQLVIWAIVLGVCLIGVYFLLNSAFK